MLKPEYPWLDDSDDARLVAASTRDLFENLALSVLRLREPRDGVAPDPGDDPRRAARRAFAGAEVALVVDHPGDRGRTVLTPAARRRLAEDLA